MQMRRNITILKAALAAFAITAIGQGLWGAMAMANIAWTPNLPWAPLVMALVLAGLVGALARRKSVLSRPVSATAWIWSILAGGCGIIAAAALWTVLASVIRVPPNLLPDTPGVPVTTLIPMLLVAIAAAPITEEIAFRGFAMSQLRKSFSPVVALLITTVLFTIAHLTQGLSAPKLLVYSAAGLTFGLIALRTGSLLPAMVVHSAADLTFFILVWPHDATRKLVWENGMNAPFLTSLALLMVFAPLSLLGFRQLVRVTGAPQALTFAAGPVNLAAA